MEDGLWGLSASYTKAYLFVAAIAGSITGTLVQKGLTVQGRLSSFFIGLTATMFCGEFVLRRIGMDVSPESSAAIYVIGMSANSVVPVVIKMVSQRIGGLSLAKPKGDE